MPSLGRASAIIGAGTLVSRMTGLVRSILLVAVIGSYESRPADAFAIASALPTNVYELLAAGVITGIIVPQIVKSAAHSDGGSKFVSKLLTLGTVVLVAATAIAMLIAPALIWIYASSYPPAQHALSVSFAYWLLPQLLFYGLYALLGEALNARRVFGPYSWAPTVNNLVSIAGFIVFLVVFGGPYTQIGDWTPGMIALLGGTSTLGIGLQTIVLLFFWKRTKLDIRPDFGWRGIGLVGGGIGEVVELHGPSGDVHIVVFLSECTGPGTVGVCCLVRPVCKVPGSVGPGSTQIGGCQPLISQGFRIGRLVVDAGSQGRGTGYGG